MGAEPLISQDYGPGEYTACVEADALLVGSDRCTVQIFTPDLSEGEIALQSTLEFLGAVVAVGAKLHRVGAAYAEDAQGDICSTLTLAGLVVAAGLAVLWFFGEFTAQEHRALIVQKDIQTTLAGAVRRLRGGQPGAIWAFLTVCSAYGFLHAAGPG